jgi:hypothetical protein
VEVFPRQDPPRDPLRDRDKVYGEAFKRRATAVGFADAAPPDPSTTTATHRSCANDRYVRDPSTTPEPGPIG